VADNSPRERYVSALMAHVAEDRYPSTTQMDAIETMLRRDQLEDFVDLLLDKLLDSRYPSIPMMRRVERLLARLPG
jgi:hypothetical protein